MIVKSAIDIKKEIYEVKKKYKNVETIIGSLADEKHNVNQVHKELRDFNNFVTMFLFAKDYQLSNYDVRFKREYFNFNIDINGSAAENLYEYAALYYIYNKWYENLEE